MQLAWEEMALLAMFLQRTGLDEQISEEESDEIEEDGVTGVVLEVFNNLATAAVALKTEAPETN
tara:strand:+ start:4275 stop:4466 length:192 start_codon:yes stop_codon:yes gene_type:complete